MDSIALRGTAVNSASPVRSRSGDVPKRQRARRTNDPLADVDLHTAHGRRIGDLVRCYLRALGNPDDAGIQSDVVAAAELVALVERKRTEALGMPGGCDLEQLVRLQNLADRKVRKLGIRATAPKTPTLRETLMGEWA